MLKLIFLPWLAIAEAREDLALLDATLDNVAEQLVARDAEVAELTMQLAALTIERDEARDRLARFDHDGDGKPGGRKKDWLDGDARRTGTARKPRADA